MMIFVLHYCENSSKEREKITNIIRSMQKKQHDVGYHDKVYNYLHWGLWNMAMVDAFYWLYKTRKHVRKQVVLGKEQVIAEMTLCKSASG